jgi:hypothetical protein
MARIDRSKRALGGAIKRPKPSAAATIIVSRGLARGRVLDYGCGFGFDADHYGWDSYDPYYRPVLPEGPFDTIVCLSVVNALSRNNRARVLGRVQELLTEDGKAYVAVPRDLPKTGKLGINHSLQNYVLLTLPSIYADDSLEIYEMVKHAEFRDRTKDHVSPRDRRRDS